MNDTETRELIVFADDEKSIRDRMMTQCSELELAHRLILFENGQ